MLEMSSFRPVYRTSNFCSSAFQDKRKKTFFVSTSAHIWACIFSKIVRTFWRKFWLSVFFSDSKFFLKFSNFFLFSTFSKKKFFLKLYFKGSKKIFFWKKNEKKFGKKCPLNCPFKKTDIFVFALHYTSLRSNNFRWL